VTKLESAEKAYFGDGRLCLTPTSELSHPPSPTKPPAAARPAIEVAHEEAESTPSPEAGRGWAFSQLVFNPGSFVSVRAGFAAYAREGETERDLRARVHSTVLADVEQQVVALRALLAMLRDPWTRARISGAWSRDCDRPSHVRA